MPSISLSSDRLRPIGTASIAKSGGFLASRKLGPLLPYPADGSSGSDWVDPKPALRFWPNTNGCGWGTTGDALAFVADEIELAYGALPAGDGWYEPEPAVIDRGRTDLVGEGVCCWEDAPEEAWLGFIVPWLTAIEDDTRLIWLGLAGCDCDMDENP